MRRALLTSTTLAVLLFAAPVYAADPPVNECDTLAAHPADTQRVAPGVQWDLMNARAAIQACSQAVKQYPDTLRFQFQLGRALLRAKRRDEGLPYLFSVAEQGYNAAFANIGGTYQFDLGNFSEAHKWYLRGAELNDVNAQTHLAGMYFAGAGVKKDYSEALRWYMPSAKNGYPLSEYYVGLIYQQGDRTVSIDHEKAIAWFKIAASHGFARAQNDLGWAYERGLGVHRDLKTAAEWYRRAAEQGWARAQINLARLYEKGLGVDQNFEEAFFWYRMASDARIQVISEAGRDGVGRIRHRIEPSKMASIDARVRRTRAIPEPTPAPPTAQQIAATIKADGGEVDPNYLPQVDNIAAVDPTYRPAPATTTVASVTPPAPKAEPAPQPAAQKAVPAPAPAAEQPAAQQTAAAAPAAIPEFEPVVGTYYAVANANVRNGPGSENAKIGTLSNGESVMVLGKVKGSGWYLVAMPGNKSGYVFSELLSDSDPNAGAKTAKTQVASVARQAEPEAAKAKPVDQSTRAALANVDFGVYHALVIGNNNYRQLPKLDTAVNDAKSVAGILKDDYGFDVNLMLDATRADIVMALDDYRKKLTEHDNLLIYYAGHGILDYSSERGYWLPVDASPDTQVSWVSNATITDTLKAMSAKHVMLVIDSCFSGTLTRSVSTTLRNPDYLRKMSKKRARVALASGGLEPVADGGGKGHSVFARAFMDALESNTGAIDGTTLFVEVRRPVMLNAMQTPEYSDIRLSGHDGGDFIFVRK